MAQPNDTKDGAIQFLRMGGLNQRVSPHALPAPDFSFLHGLYPAHDGLLERLPGIETVAQVGTGTAAVWSIFQPNDGTDNLIVQTSDGTERFVTLAEIFGRTVTSSLTYTPQQDDEAMPTAIILQDAANGTDGATVGAASNTIYDRGFTSIPLNESTIIVGNATPTFDLAPGTYRVRGFVSFSVAFDATTASTDAATCGVQAVLVNTTDSATISTGSPASIRFVRANLAANDLGPVTLYSHFDDSFDVITSNKTFKVQNGYTTVGSNTTFAVLQGQAADVSAVVNGAALRQPYMKLVISKVA